MTQSRLRIIQVAILATAAMPLLTGCQPQKLIARVNNQTITEEQFNARVQRIRASNFPQELNTDAGGVTLLSMIQSSLVDQCAANDPSIKTTPSDETLKAYVNQVAKMFPDVANKIKSGETTPEELATDVKTQLEMLAIGTDGAKPDETDLTAMYEELKAKHAADYPTLYTIRFITAQDPTTAATVLEDLKKTGNFAAQAKTLNIPEESAAQLNRTTVVTPNQLPANVLAVLDTLKPNDFTPSPIAITPPASAAQQPTGAQTRYMVAQLVSKEPGRTPTMQEIRVQLTQMALEKKFPQWSQHAAQRIAEFTEKANIEIMVDRYKPLLSSVILANAKRRAAAASASPAGLSPSSAPGGSQPGAPQ